MLLGIKLFPFEIVYEDTPWVLPKITSKYPIKIVFNLYTEGISKGQGEYILLLFTTAYYIYNLDSTFL